MSSIVTEVAQCLYSPLLTYVTAIRGGSTWTTRLTDRQMVILPGEAAFAVAASLLRWQHVRIRLAGKQQLPDLKGSGDAETSPFARTVKPLQPLYAARHCAPILEMTLRPWQDHSTSSPAGTRQGSGIPLQVAGRHPPNNSNNHSHNRRPSLIAVRTSCLHVWGKLCNFVIALKRQLYIAKRFYLAKTDKYAISGGILEDWN